MLKIADFRAFCRVFRRTIFASVLCFFALFSFGEKSSAYAVDYKFTMTTTNLSAGDTVNFSLAASGTFYVDCGNGGVLTSSNNDVTGLTGAYTITRYNTTPVTYTCTYASIGGVKTMRFGGLATGYGEGGVFGNGMGACKIASVSGNISAVFPQLGPNQNQLPKFSGMFDSCSTLTSISGDLFANITTGTEWMFANTFMQTGLTSIPSNLFANITTGAPYMFYMTFSKCDNLQSFPADLFIGITNAEESMFQQTFYGVGDAATAPTKSFVSPDFFAGLVTNQSPYATNMMLDVFRGAAPLLLTECPEDHYQYITGYENYWGLQGANYKAVSCKKCPNNPVYTHSPAGSTSINQCVPTNIVFDCGTAASGGSWIGGQLSLNHNNLSCYDNVNIQMPNNSTTINNCHASSLASVQGWNCAQGDTSLGTNLQPGTNFTQQCMPYDNVDVVCTAQWAYPISYGSGNHGSVSNNGADPVVYANGLTYGSPWTTKTFAETGIVADTGYVFTHWNTSADGTGTSYAANTLQSAWTTDSGLTLYAVYGCDTANGYELVNNECVQQTCAEGESLNVLDDLNLFKPEGTLSGFGFDMNGVLFGEGHHEYLNETPNTFGVWNVDQDEFLLGSAMCSKDDEGFSPASSLNVDSQNPEENKYCWCSLTGVVQKDAQYPLSPSTWVYLTGDLGSYCEKYCAEYCAGSGLGYSGDYRDFIRKLLRQEYCTPQQYKVSFYCKDRSWLDGEEPLFVDTVFYGSSGYSFDGDENMASAEPCAPAGYHVDGFKCFTATNEDPVDDSVANPWTINDDVVCLANYAPNYYIITLNKVNGSGGANNVYTIYNGNVYKNSNRNVPMTYPGQSGHNSASNISVPTKSGFVFDGYWSATGNNGVQYIDENGYITQNGLNAGKFVTNNNAIWYAHWAPKTYTISYGSGSHGSVPNNGADPVVYANGLTYGSPWTTKTFAETGIVADTNYVFSHWNTSADGTGTSYAANTLQSAWTTDSGLTLYAIYGCDTGYTMNSYNECVQQSYTVSFLLGDSNNDGTGTAAEWHGTQFIYNPINGVYYEDLIDLLSYVSEASDYVYISGHEYDYHFDGFKCQTENSGTVLNAGQGGVWDEFFTMPADDVVCTAQWAPNKYSILYGSGSHGSVPNNGADPVVYANGLTYGSPWTTKTFAETGIVADTNYVFSHWNTSADGSGTTYQAGTLQSAYTDNADLTVYAIYDCATGYVWNNSHTQCLKTYDVEYHACDEQYLDNNDTTGLLTDTLSRPNPQYIALYEQTGLKSIKTGYHYLDTWLDDNNVSHVTGNSEQINLDDNTSPLQLYAQCVANQTNVRYYCGEDMVHSDYATYDQSYTFYNNANACSPCAMVTGWNCSYVGKEETLSNRPYSGSHDVGQTVTWNDPMDSESGYDCVAVIQGNSYQITYSGGTATNPNNPNSATHAVTTVAMSPQNVHYGDQNVTLNANTYSQEGYNFDGWSCTGTVCGQQTSDTFTVDDDGQNIGTYKFGTNLECTAQWTPEKYTVTYDYGAHAANNATGVAYTHINGAMYDANYTVPEAANDTITPATGYVFVGWNTSSGQTTENWTGATPWTQTTGLTVYAAYDCATGYTMNSNNECVAYTLSYAPGDSNNEASGGIPATGSMNPSQHAGNSSVTLTPNGFTAPTGYHFNRWVCTKDGVNENNNVQVTESSGTYSITMPNNNVTCTAQWAPNEIGLTWLLNNGNWMIDGNENELSNQNSCDYGTSNGITVYDPVRRGFGFIGWEVEGVSGQ